MIDRELVARLAEQAVAGSLSHPEAVGALVSAATSILIEDIGPEGAIETLEGLAATTRLAFSAQGSVQ